MTSWLLVIGVFCLARQSMALKGETCSKDEHQKCISLADPLLKNPKLVFPDNIEDINNVCRTWSNFVDCIRRYIEKCFSKERREKFNSAVEVSIESVHQMCSVPQYQHEYLQYAPCIKATVINSDHCGNQYGSLVGEVSRKQVVKPSLCCAHYNFQTCVIMETRRRCDGNQPEGTAAKFSKQILDKALSFLQDQCANYIPNLGNCPFLRIDDETQPLSVSPLNEDSSFVQAAQSRPYQRTAPPDTYSSKSSDFYGASSNTAYPTASRSTGRALNLPLNPEIDGTKDLQPSSTQVTSNTHHWNTVTGKFVNEQEIETTTEKIVMTTKVDENNNVEYNINNGDVKDHVNSVNDEEAAIVSPQRSSSYGRGIMWTTQNSEPSSEIPAWATSTWLNSNQIAMTENSWDQDAENNIDEPNQQGLSKNSQSSSKNTIIVVTLLLVGIVLIF